MGSMLDRQYLISPRCFPVADRIVLGLAMATAVGVPAARRMKMTAMPQMVALFNVVGWVLKGRSTRRRAPALLQATQAPSPRAPWPYPRRRVVAPHRRGCHAGC